jgi:hypothetical protein
MEISPGSQWEHLIRNELRKQQADFSTLTRTYETGVKLEPFYVPSRPASVQPPVRQTVGWHYRQLIGGAHAWSLLQDGLANETRHFRIAAEDARNLPWHELPALEHTVYLGIEGSGEPLTLPTPPNVQVVLEKDSLTPTLFGLAPPSSHESLPNTYIDAAAVAEAGATAALEVFYAIFGTRAASLEQTQSPEWTVRFCLGRNLLLEVAKLRSFRIILEQVLPGLADRLKVEGLTARYTKTLNDEPSNLIRSTVEALAGVWGGVDELTITPHTYRRAPFDATACRLARNISHLLRYESWQAQVPDPTAGAYAIEKLTEQLTTRVLSLLDDYGQFWSDPLTVWQKGLWQALIRPMYEEKIARLSAGKVPVIGVNRFAPTDLQTPAAHHTSGDHLTYLSDEALAFGTTS